MEAELSSPLSDQLLAMGDDELILGHRNSEWCGFAPILEEDIAFANIALDEISHATLWYTLLAELLAEDPETYPDRLVYEREPGGFRNIQLVELPKGDWAFSILRQFFFDAAEAVRLTALAESRYRPLSDVAVKIRKEEVYHYRHSLAWVRRLGHGTEESHHRLQTALNVIWPLTLQLFSPLPGEAPLVEAGFIPPSGITRTVWEERVRPTLEEADLVPPEGQGTIPERREHTAQFKVLVAELQSVARLDPRAKW